MKLKRKLSKVLRFVRRYNVLKSLYWRYFKLRLPRESSFCVGSKSIIAIDRTADVAIAGELIINDSWFDTRKRRSVGEFRLDKNSVFVCEGNFSFYEGSYVYVAQNAKLVLHGGGYMNTNSFLNCFNHIEIGKNCYISDNVCIIDSDSHCVDGKWDNVKSPVIIGDNVWIGKNAVILKGVSIGEGSVVGAGAVVTKDVPSKMLVAGNPAKPIRMIEKWE